MAAAKAAFAHDFITRAARGLRHLPRRTRRAPVGRPAPAHQHRPRDAEEPAAAAAGRGHQRARRRERAHGAGRARIGDERPHHAGHRPPAGHGAARRPHRRDGGRAHRRHRHATTNWWRAAACMRGWRRCSSAWSRPNPHRPEARSMSHAAFASLHEQSLLRSTDRLAEAAPCNLSAERQGAGHAQRELGTEHLGDRSMRCWPRRFVAQLLGSGWQRGEHGEAHRALQRRASQREGLPLATGYRTLHALRQPVTPSSDAA